jgi:hypothetical protein
MATHQVLRHLQGMFCLLVVLYCSGCVTYVGYDGPYEGRVIDAETRRPIEGAVVHGTWARSHPGPGGASSSYFDSKETLTDKDGNFKIKGVGIQILSNVEEMEINVLKTGYTQWSEIYWSSQKTDSVALKNVEWKGNRAIIKLRRMTLEERRKRIINLPTSEPDKKQRLLRIEYNKEMIESGITSSPTFKME